MEKYSAECYSWFKFIYVKGLTSELKAGIYLAICENKLTMIELFYLSNFELNILFSTLGTPSYYRTIFQEFQRVNKLNLRKEFEKIWKSTFLIPWTHPNYPQKIKKRLGVDAPPLFFGKGHLPLINNPTISILGDEEVSSKIIKTTWRMSSYFARNGYNILSNHNWGVAEHAHKSALRADGTTTGILPHGFDDFSVRTNIQNFGWEFNTLFLTPFKNEISPTTANKIKACQLITAWSDALVIIESRHLHLKKKIYPPYESAIDFALENNIPVLLVLEKTTATYKGTCQHVYHLNDKKIILHKNIIHYLRQISELA